MSIKRYICGVLSAILVSSGFCLPVIAKNGGIEINITDLDVGMVEVTGQVEKTGYVVNLLVLKKTDNQNTIEIQHQNDVVSGEDGEFKFNFKVYNKNEYDEGWYIVYVGGDGFDQVVSDEFYFASPSSKKMAISALNKAANETNKDFGQIYIGYSDMFNLKNAEIEGINKSAMYKMLGEYVKENNFGEDDFAKVKEVFRIYNILEAYNDGLESVIGEGELLMLEELGIDITAEDVIYDIYNELNSDGIDALADGMVDKGYTDIEGFEKTLKEQIAIAAIFNPEQSGTGHIKEILTDDVCNELGIDISDYKNSKYKTEIEAELLQSKINDAKDLESTIKNITATIKKKHSSGSGSGSSGSGGGASVGGGSNVFISVQNAGGDYIKEETKVKDNPFTDVDVTHWAYPSIEQLYERGIINGVDEYSYKPDAYVTREQLAKIVCTMIGEDVPDGNPGFTDVEAERWSARFISVCKNKGYVTGYPDNTFAPSGYVTRQDIAVILSRVMNKKAENDIELQFKDKDNINDYAVEAVKYFVQKGIIKGYEDDSFKPQKNCTRAEAASIIYACIREMEGSI